MCQDALLQVYVGQQTSLHTNVIVYTKSQTITLLNCPEQLMTALWAMTMPGALIFPFLRYTDYRFFSEEQRSCYHTCQARVFVNVPQ